MPDWVIVFVVLGVLAVVWFAVKSFASGFFGQAGSDSWDSGRKRNELPTPAPAIPVVRERHFVTQHQFQNWTGHPRAVYDARRAEGYEFSLQVDDRVPAFESEGWERMLMGELELWWRNPSGVPCVFLMRRQKFSS